MARTETERELNTGIEVDTKHLGKVTVRELSLESVLSIAKEIGLLLSKVDLSDATSLSSLAAIASEPATMSALKKLAVSSTGKKESDFAKLPPADWMRIMVALKEVTDFEEMKELFFQLVSMEALQTEG